MQEQRYRDTVQGQRQAAVLRRAEQASGRKRSAIVADLDAAIDVGYDQYRRYLRGDTPLRWDQIEVFARVFGVTTAELTLALGLMEPSAGPEPPWSMAAALRGQIPQDVADELVERWKDRSELAQRAIVSEVITKYRQIAREVSDEMLARPCHRTRPA